ncbi:MAG: ATP-dependent Clp protease proteolytic subunit [Planctomycetaceae bacterium]|nr:ATP-dependent Clp protease proteolytic subunit [Planctomycetaceae bacterium]
MSRSRLSAYPAVATRSRGGSGPAEPRDGWEIMICGDLSDKQLELTERLVSVPAQSRGTIFFDSCGGSAYVGLGLAALIRLRGLDPLAVVTGECSSAAILPFAACRRRCVTSHATLLFHPIRWQSEEDVRIEEATEWARHFQLMEKDLDQLLAKLFECEIELLQRWTRPGRFVSGTELVDAGLAELIDLFAGDVWKQLRDRSAHP